MHETLWTRRRLLTVGIALSAAPWTTMAATQSGLKSLPFDSEPAKALGYHPAAETVTDPARVAGSHCGNCQFHQPDGGCPVFPGYRVSSSGWCKVWATPEA